MCGASPRVSTTSNAAVFCPCRRYGFTEFTRATGWDWASARTMRRQSSKLPSTASSVAPCTIACTSLPAAILPAGRMTAQPRPARTAYAAAEAEVLPVEAHTTIWVPVPATLLIAIVMPRSLKDPVGFAPSTLR